MVSTLIPLDTYCNMWCIFCAGVNEIINKTAWRHIRHPRFNRPFVVSNNLVCVPAWVRDVQQRRERVRQICRQPLKLNRKCCCTVANTSSSNHPSACKTLRGWRHSRGCRHGHTVIRDEVAAVGGVWLDRGQVFLHHRRVGCDER